MTKIYVQSTQGRTRVQRRLSRISCRNLSAVKSSICAAQDCRGYKYLRPVDRSTWHAFSPKINKKELACCDNGGKIWYVKSVKVSKMSLLRTYQLADASK